MSSSVSLPKSPAAEAPIVLPVRVVHHAFHEGAFYIVMILAMFGLGTWRFPGVVRLAPAIVVVVLGFLLMRDIIAVDVDGIHYTRT